MPTSLKKQVNRQPSLTVIAIVALIVALIFFQPFIGTICVAALAAFLLFPLHKRFVKRISPKFSAIILLVVSFLLVIVPLLFIAFTAAGQAVALGSKLSELDLGGKGNLVAIITPVVDNVNHFLSSIGISNIDSSQVSGFFNQIIPVTLKQAASIILGLLSSVPALFINLVAYSFLFIAFLQYHKQIMAYAKSVSPFDEKLSNEYATRSALIVTASLKGQFIISLVTAVTSSLLLFLLDMQSYFVFFVIALTLLGMIPLGSGIVVIPIALIAMVSGNFWPGFWVLVIYLGIICNLDTVLRPVLIPKKANIIPALITLSTFCGIYYFGMLGIVYGPLIVTLLLITLDVYAAYRQRLKGAEPTSA